MLQGCRTMSPCSWHLTGIPLVCFSLPSSVSLFQSFSSNTCLYTFSHCEHRLIYVSHYSLFVSRCSFYALILCWLFPLTIHLWNKLLLILCYLVRPYFLPYFVLLLFLILNFSPSSCAIKLLEIQSQGTQFENQPGVLGPSKSVPIYPWVKVWM